MKRREKKLPVGQHAYRAVALMSYLYKRIGLQRGRVLHSKPQTSFTNVAHGALWL